MSQNNYVRPLTKSERHCISELPDDIIFSIFSYLTVKEAANASAVSSRWRQLTTSISDFSFYLESMFLPHKDCSNECNCRGQEEACQPFKDMYVRAVNQFIQFCKGSHISCFRISLCLEKDSTYDIDQWVSFAVRRDVQVLHLGFLCGNCYSNGKRCQYENLYTLRSELFSQGNMAKVQKLEIGTCILGPGVLNQFSNLSSLHIWNVNLGAHEVEILFSCCTKLETMRLDNCALILILCIPSSLRLLKFVAISKCCELKEIELCAPNLTRFNYEGQDLQISSSKAPNLKQAFFSGLGERILHYLFTQLPKDCPLVENLSVYSNANWVRCIPGRIITFNKLRQLDFFSPINVNFDVLKIVSILKACPFLEKFHVVMCSDRPRQAGPTFGVIMESHHKHLKEVHIGGFRGTGRFFDLAIYILKYAIALERMVIDPMMEVRIGVDDWISCGRRTWNEREREFVSRILGCQTQSSVLSIL